MEKIELEDNAYAQSTIDLMKFVTNDSSRELYAEIKRVNKVDNKYAYYSYLKRTLNISGPTINKYLTKLLEANLIHMSFAEIETSESFVSIKKSMPIKRTRKIWIKIFTVANNQNTKRFEQLIQMINNNE